MPLHVMEQLTIGKHSRLNRQIWYRHLNSEAGSDEIQIFKEEIFILWELHSIQDICTIPGINVKYYTSVPYQGLMSNTRHLYLVLIIKP
jgi:hypothetical protein